MNLNISITIYAKILSTHLKLSNWISNNNLAFIGMSPGMPLEPYASNGLAVMMAL